LIENKADVTHTARYNNTALTIAISRQDAALASLLTE
jgi:hypothetical protein